VLLHLTCMIVQGCVTLPLIYPHHNSFLRFYILKIWRRKTYCTNIVVNLLPGIISLPKKSIPVVRAVYRRVISIRAGYGMVYLSETADGEFAC
jgi:hypothetical protein